MPLVVKPVGARCVMIFPNVEQKVKGLILPEQEQRQYGTIVEMGEAHSFLKLGDKIVVNKYAAYEVPLEDQRYFIVEFKDIVGVIVDEEDQETGVFAISLVENPAIEENWIYLSKQHKIMLSEANNEKRLLIGPVLIPNKEIPRIDQETGEEYDIVFDEAVIEKAAQLFLQRQHNNDSTLEHGKPIDDISIVESWIIACPYPP